VHHVAQAAAQDPFLVEGGYPLQRQEVVETAAANGRFERAGDSEEENYLSDFKR